MRARVHLPERQRRGVRKHDSGVTIASADAYDAICVQSGLKLQLLQRRAAVWVGTGSVERGKWGTEGGKGIGKERREGGGRRDSKNARVLGRVWGKGGSEETRGGRMVTALSDAVALDKGGLPGSVRNAGW